MEYVERSHIATTGYIRTEETWFAFIAKYPVIGLPLHAWLCYQSYILCIHLCSFVTGIDMPDGSLDATFTIVKSTLDLLVLIGYHIIIIYIELLSFFMGIPFDAGFDMLRQMVVL
jgi:hypothetical protein